MTNMRSASHLLYKIECRHARTGRRVRGYAENLEDENCNQMFGPDVVRVSFAPDLTQSSEVLSLSSVSDT